MHPNLEHEVKQRIAECPTPYPMPINEEELARFLRWSRRRQFQVRDQLYVALWYGKTWVQLSGATIAFAGEGYTLAPTPVEVNKSRLHRHHIAQEEWDKIRQIIEVKEIAIDGVDEFFPEVLFGASVRVIR